MKVYTDAELIEYLKTEIVKAGSQSAWAAAHGFSRSFVNDVLAGTRNVTGRLAAALGFKAIRSWRQR